MLSIFFLGFSSGLPLLLTASTLGVWFVEEGISKATIGALSLVGLPYTFKFLWAPLFDQLQIPILSKYLGRRRSFMLLTQILLIASLVGLGMSDPRITPFQTALCALLTAFFSASQDIVIDAFRVEILDEKSYGTGAATVVFGYRVGMIMAAAGSLYLASFVSWHVVYFIMAALILVGVLTCLLSKEPPEHSQKLAPAEGRIFQRAIWAPFQEFIKHKQWFYMLLLIMFYKLGDAFLTSMTNVFFLEIGFSKIEIANVAKVFGLVATLCGGFIAAACARRVGILRAMLYCGLIHVVANIIFVVQAFVGYSLFMLVLTIGLENITAGMTGVALVAYISSLCNKTNTATQYALLSSLIAVGRTVLSSSAGYFAGLLGWPLYFLFTSLIAVPALMIIVALLRRERLASAEKSFGTMEPLAPS